MSTRGLPTGLGSESSWQRFTPDLRAFVHTGGSNPTQPALNSADCTGHYVYERQTGLVTYQGRIQFASDTTYGSGDDVWGVRLPVPAYRSLGGADLLVGAGWAWQGSAGNRNVPLRATLMDPLPPDGMNSNEDYYIQFFLPYTVATGTGTLPGSNGTSVTVTHASSGTNGLTPNAFDINVVPTNSASTAPGEIYVDTITSTQFNVNVRAGATTTPQTFAWKVRAEPNATVLFDLLVNSQRPFLPSGWASGYQLSWHVQYQARR